MLFPTTLFIALLLQAASTKTIFLKTNDKNVPWNILEGISLYDKQNSLTSSEACTWPTSMGT